MPVVAICGCHSEVREFLSESAFLAHVQTVHPEMVADEASASSGKARDKAHIIARAKMHGVTDRLPQGWGPNKDSASSVLIDCPECARVFLDEWGLIDHADAVHTFNDIERMVSEAVRENYAKRGDYEASPPVSATWAWVVDVSEDWVVFTVEKDTDSTLFKASYTILDNTVTLGSPTEVTRKTVYEAISS